MDYHSETAKGMDLSPYSLDFNPYEFFLWGHLKDVVYWRNLSSDSEPNADHLMLTLWEFWDFEERSFEGARDIFSPYLQVGSGQGSPPAVVDGPKYPTSGQKK